MDFLIAKAWERCDHAALAELQEASPLVSVPSLRRAFFPARNENWANTIAARGAAEERQLLVVDALHLVGPDSRLDRLAARGLVVHRLIT
ncbi:TraB/GumN family protein [Variovorax sp. PAMC26660]|nr:TraB/GumN family protein [Variovorax sp. PAMC26660]